MGSLCPLSPKPNGGLFWLSKVHKLAHFCLSSLVPTSCYRRTRSREAYFLCLIEVILTLNYSGSYFVEKPVQGWTEWSSWSQCMSTYLGCYRSKYRICFGENPSACPGADETGVGYNTEKCASPEECKSM